MDPRDGSVCALRRVSFSPWRSKPKKVAHVCLCGCEGRVGVRWERKKRRGGGCRNNRGLLGGLSLVACLLAVNLISEEKYTLSLHNAALCLRTESELSTILEIVSSLLKYFQTVTVEAVSFPANCLASFPILCL